MLKNKVPVSQYKRWEGGGGIAQGVILNKIPSNKRIILLACRDDLQREQCDHSYASLVTCLITNTH